MTIPTNSRNEPQRPKVSTPALADPLALAPRPKAIGHEELIDMTAMVDVVFFLLIFFMVTSLHSKQASIEMPAPRAEASDGTAGAKTAAPHRTVDDYEADDGFVVVRIDADNTVWVEEDEASSRTDVAVKLRGRLRGAGRQSTANRLLVVGSGAAAHGTAVMVLDAGRDAGLSDVRLAVENDDEP